ncbi:hypothetical protein [Azospirillum agricola]|uniref:hypothetical protein n=1 Tax=Azospirillum agricola TaxID=1720247 RepID=UPI000A1C90ED|nr:hypothetical protein [Azospirillum agricola]
MSVGPQRGLRGAGFIAAALLGMLLAWAGGALLVAPVAAMTGSVAAMAGASAEAAPDFAADALPDDDGVDQRDPDDDRAESAGTSHANCGMVACSMLVPGPSRLPMTSAAWARARTAMVIDACHDGRSISPPQRPPKAMACRPEPRAHAELGCPGSSPMR